MVNVLIYVLLLQQFCSIHAAICPPVICPQQCWS